jgi:hypothetical protein
VRTSVGVGLVTVCLGLAGCSVFGKRQAAQNSPAPPPSPFAASPAPGDTRVTPTANAAAPVTDPAGPLPGANIALAGHVLDRNGRRPSTAALYVSDIEANTAPIQVEAKDGYFFVPRLVPGHRYKLMAVLKDGERTLSGMTVTQPPNPRVLIEVSEDLTTPSTPSPPGPPTIPGRPDKHGPGKDSKTSDSPAASLDPPVKAPVDVSPRPGTVEQPQPDLSRTAQGNDNVLNGFNRLPDRPANVPGPSAVPLPPPPSMTPAPPRPAPPAAADVPWKPAAPEPEGPSTRLPDALPPAPSCALEGRQLLNFVLFDLDGRPWEYRRQHTGRLVLLDFWYSECPPCLGAIKDHLVPWQRDYGGSGLQVVGIAYERSRPEDRVNRVRWARSRWGINYTMLMGGGGRGPCPVQTQFGVKEFPTLFLIDGTTGEVLWRKAGLGERDAWELENIIRTRLGVR